jgi:hypothetical protein
MPTVLILPSINRAVFEYDGRPKKDIICYITRPDKHPETACLLRERYGDKVIEIVNSSEADVAETLKCAKVFVFRGHQWEGSPRPPKEALVAGCVVVGLEADLNERYHTDFGIRCSTVDELIKMSGEALKMEIPSADERSVVRDSKQEKRDWFELLENLGIHENSTQKLHENKSIVNRRSRERAVAVFAANLRSAQADEALVLERQNRIEPLGALVDERQGAVDSLAAQLAERNQLVESLSLQLAEKDERLRASTAQIGDQYKALQSLTSLLADKEQALESLAAQDTKRRRALQTLSAQLAEKAAEIDRITNSFGWRLLSLYGKIKYPYLLPIYRLLGLASRKPKPGNTDRTKDEILKNGKLTNG